MVLSFLFGKWRKELIGKIHNSHLDLHSTVSNSFQTVKRDMGAMKEWISHLHLRDKHHENSIKYLESRIELLELSLGGLAVQKQKPERQIAESGKTDNIWDTLTETQQQICWKLASLQKETPDRWISLKYLAQEIYPDKEYFRVRSALSQYISVLEDLGIVARKRKGKNAYVFSTENNPCLKQQIPIEIKL